MPTQRNKICIPVFISSTCEDLKQYREEVKNVVIKSEAFPICMEFFGSTPNAPLEECLENVRKSKIYIGIIAHRYGDIDKASGKSFTRLEYEEAQRLRLPALIYLIDANQPFPSEYVDEGVKKEKLLEFKNMLKERHQLSIVTTPDNLARHVAEDLRDVLSDIKEGNPLELLVVGGLILLGCAIVMWVASRK